jgi:hypothetical protein
MLFFLLAQLSVSHYFYQNVKNQCNGRKFGHATKLRSRGFFGKYFQSDITIFDDVNCKRHILPSFENRKKEYELYHIFQETDGK